MITYELPPHEPSIRKRLQQLQTENEIVELIGSAANSGKYSPEFIDVLVEDAVKQVQLIRFRGPA